MKDLYEENLNSTEWLKRVEQMGGKDHVIKRLNIIEITFIS